METLLIVNLGHINDIPVGQGVCFIIKGEEVAVFRDRDGKIFAVENQCPHRRGPLAEGVIGGGKVVCPLHGHKFDLATGQGHEPRECVRVFKTWVDNEQIFLQYSKSSQYAEDKMAIS